MTNGCSDALHLVALEGPSGIGKTKMLAALYERLISTGLTVCAVSNNETARWQTITRELATNPTMKTTLTLAVAAARAELLENRRVGTLLLCDRFVLSSYVYQVYAGVDADYVRAVNKPFLPNTLTICLTLPVENLLNRRKQRPDQRNDIFKKDLTASAEVALYQAAVVMRTKDGGAVREHSADTSPNVLATSLADFILATNCGCP